VRVVLVADEHLQAAVAQVERLGAVLVALADDGDLFVLEQAQVGVGVAIDAHAFFSWDERPLALWLVSRSFSVYALILYRSPFEVKRLG
jgi:hypothetical protein